jgi:hypothetical protein
MNPEILQKALDALESGDAAAMTEALKAIVAGMAAGTPPASDEALESAAEPKPEDPNAPAEKAALAALVKLTGATGVGEAVAKLTAMAADVAKLKAESDALEGAQRRELVGELVKLRCEDPSTAWEGDPKDQKPAAHLAAEPIDSLRNRVAKLRAQRPQDDGHKPPAGKGADELDDTEVKLTANYTPAQLAKYKALRASRRAS